MNTHSYPKPWSFRPGSNAKRFATQLGKVSKVAR
jgi:hypothetical protein